MAHYVDPHVYFSHIQQQHDQLEREYHIAALQAMRIKQAQLVSHGIEINIVRSMVGNPWVFHSITVVLIVLVTLGTPRM